MSLTKKIIVLIVMIFALGGRHSVNAGGLNIPAESNNGRICEVTSLVDDELIQGSLRRAMNQGYNVENSSLPSFCKEKIVFKEPGEITLRAPLILNNTSATGFVLEKAEGVTGEVVLAASGIGEGGCAIEIASSNVTIRGITIKNAPNAGICIKNGFNENKIDQVKVTGGNYGVIIEAGSQKNTVQKGAFYNNKTASIQLADTNQNEVTQNALQSTPAPIESSAANIQATISSATSSNSPANTQWRITGSVPAPVQRCEIFRGEPSENSNNYLAGKDITEFAGLTFNKDIEAANGDKIFIVCIATDGMTSPASAVTTLSTVGSGNPGQPGSTGCTPGQSFSPIADSDNDGLFDVDEDKMPTCVRGPDETDRLDPDTDDDEILDGIEVHGRLGTDPLNADTDGDTIPDGMEDLNHNGRLDPSECDPTNSDTDGDNLPDNIEDKNLNGKYDPTENETKCYHPDTDFDGVTDGLEDKNHDGLWDPIRESDPRKPDTDIDGLLDGSDLCPNNTSPNCRVPCVPGVVPAEDLDNDGDLIPDLYEDLNSDCRVDSNETDPFKKDTDGDGRNDNRDPCPNSTDPNCQSFCTPEIINEFFDSDGDGLKNIDEDENQNCIVDPGESDPFNQDTDRDGINDGNDTCKLDPNPLCDRECQPGVTPPETQDSDGDGIPDIYEDINQNCIQDVSETNFRKRDTDGDGTNDNNDPCPLNPDPACVKECIPGEFIPPQRDSDRDGIKDVIEDTNKNCIREITETDAYSNDTDADGLADGMEDKNQDGIVDSNETDPRAIDTDSDGIPDGVEDKNHNGRVDFDELNPLTSDTDSDGIVDYLEDRNLNGILDSGETNGARADSDQDGLSDGQEDLNHNGLVDAGESSASLSDTDGDGANDGQEVNQGTSPIIPRQGDLNRAIGKGCSLNPAATPTSAPFWIFGMSMFALVGLRVRRKA